MSGGRKRQDGARRMRLWSERLHLARMLPDETGRARMLQSCAVKTAFAIGPMVVVAAIYAAGLRATAVRTVWDGVYTKEQAARGEQTYIRSCAYCHRDNLQGDEGPALIGSRFTFQWKGRTLRDLFDTVSNTMPDDAPGTLTSEQYADVITFLLKANGAPQGDTELTTDPDALGAVTFTDKPK